MTQQNRNITAQFGYKVNAQSIQQVVQANQQVVQSLQTVQAAGGRTAVQFNTAAQAAQALNLSAAQMQQLGLQTQNVATQAAAATTQLNNVAAAAARTPAGTLSSLAQAGIALPGVGFQSPLVVGLRAAAAAADATGASFLQLGVAGGLVGVAVVGLAVAFDQFTKGIQEAKKHLDAALTAQDNYYDALATLTTKEARARIEEIARRGDLLRQQLAETNAAKDRAFALEQTLPGGDIVARALHAAGLVPSAQLEAQAQELQKEFDALGQTFTRLKQGVQSNVFAYNDLIQAQEDHTKALKDSSDAINDGLKDIAAAAQDVQQATERVAEVRQALKDLDADARQKSIELAQDTDDKVLQAQADAEDKRQQIAADGAEKRQEIDAEDADRRAEILKRFNTDYFSAVADRDALAAFKAKQTRDDDLEKQDKAYKKQLDNLQKQLDKQYAAVDKALEKQLRTIEAQYQRQQRSIDDAYNKQLRNLNQSLKEALAAEQFANNRLEALRSDNAFRAQYWAGVVETANKRMADAAAALSVSLTQSAERISKATDPVGRGAGGPDKNGNRFPPLSDNNGNILSANRSAFPPLSETTGNLGIIGGAPSRNTLPGSRATNRNAVFAPVVNINGTNMTPSQVERVAVNAMITSARKAGFR